MSIYLRKSAAFKALCEKLPIVIRDDEGDVVVRADDMRDERIDQIVTEGLAADTLHGGHPQVHIVLLLLTQNIGEFIGINQRQCSQNHTDNNDHDAAAKRYFKPR